MEKEDLKEFLEKIEAIDELPNQELDHIYECDIKFQTESIDDHE